MIIRQIAQADVAPLTGLARHALSFAATNAQFWAEATDEQVRRRLGLYVAADTYFGLVAEADQEIAGLVACSLVTDADRTDRYARIDLLAVEEQHRGHGIGTQLVQELILTCRERGVEQLDVDVVWANDVAMRFWRRAGFREFSVTMRARTGRSVTGETQP